MCSHINLIKTYRLRFDGFIITLICRNIYYYLKNVEKIKKDVLVR